MNKINTTLIIQEIKKISTYLNKDGIIIIEIPNFKSIWRKIFKTAIRLLILTNL